jgi:uncharacterized RDD family membrane protein YckC
MDSAIPSPAQPPSSASPPAFLPRADVDYICGFWRRVIALLVDLVVLFLLLAFPALRWFDYFSSHPMAALTLGFVVTFPYFIILNSRIGDGQTLGKKITKIRVADLQGNVISLQRSTLRFCVLAIPFFFEEVQFTCSGGLCAVTTSVTWLLTACRFATAYLYIFNTRTRQSLHDLVAQTYVIDADLWPLQQAKSAVTNADPVAGWFGSQFVTREQIWKTHFVILGALFLIGGFGGVFAGRKVVEMEPFPDLFAMQNAINQSGKVRSLSVMASKTWSTNRASTSIVVTATPLNAEPDDETQAKEIAAIALDASSKTAQVDSLDIVILHIVNFGLAHYSYKRSFSHSPDEWRTILGRPAPRITSFYSAQPLVQFATSTSAHLASFLACTA